MKSFGIYRTALPNSGCGTRPCQVFEIEEGNPDGREIIAWFNESVTTEQIIAAIRAIHPDAKVTDFGT